VGDETHIERRVYTVALAVPTLTIEGEIVLRYIASVIVQLDFAVWQISENLSPGASFRDALANSMAWPCGSMCWTTFVLVTVTVSTS
jgi:hypothetical protein